MGFKLLFRWLPRWMFWYWSVNTAFSNQIARLIWDVIRKLLTDDIKRFRCAGHGTIYNFVYFCSLWEQCCQTFAGYYCLLFSQRCQHSIGVKATFGVNILAVPNKYQGSRATISFAMSTIPVPIPRPIIKYVARNLIWIISPCVKYHVTRVALVFPRHTVSLIHKATGHGKRNP